MRKLQLPAPRGVQAAHGNRIDGTTKKRNENTHIRTEIMDEKQPWSTMRVLRAKHQQTTPTTTTTPTITTTTTTTTTTSTTPITTTTENTAFDASEKKTMPRLIVRQHIQKIHKHYKNIILKCADCNALRFATRTCSVQIRLSSYWDEPKLLYLSKVLTKGFRKRIGISRAHIILVRRFPK